MAAPQEDDRSSSFRDRVIEQRNTDKEQIDAWMQGAGAEILAAVAGILAIGFLWKIGKDSPILLIAILAVVATFVVVKRLDLW